VTEPAAAAAEEDAGPDPRKATVDPAMRILEEHRKRNAAGDEDTHRELAAVRSRLAERLQRMGADMPPGPPEEEDAPLWDDMAAYQAQMRRAGWERSMRDGLFDDFAHWTLDQLAAAGEAANAAVARAWADAIGPGARKLNLVIVGNVGSGKTALAVAVGDASVTRGLTARIVTHEQYLTWLRPGQAPDGMTEHLVRSRYRRHTQVLVVDDLGAEMEGGASEHARKETVALLGDRFDAALPTVVTTNLTSAQVVQALGQRAYSRFAGSAHVIQVVGPDHRNPASWG
jgi:DNA replication protein DnaC